MIKKEIDKYISKIPSSLSLFEIQKTKQQQLQKKKKKHLKSSVYPKLKIHSIYVSKNISYQFQTFFGWALY